MGDIIHSKPVFFAESSFPQGLLGPFEPGDVIADRYEVRAVLGHGGVGYVLAAADVRTGHEVALKFLRPELADQDDMVRKFRVEAMTYAKIESPYVVRIEAVDDLANGTPFMVMELLDGHDLGYVLERRGTLPVKTAVDYVLQACEGLAAAHAAGIRHFDLKPANLFLVDEGQSSEHVELIDFGGSRGPTCAIENVCSGQTLIGIGSPLYMAPEQERGVPEPDDRSDIWSLGCVLYELLAGEPVFARRSEPDGPQPSIILDEDALGPRLDCPAISPELELVIRRCLQEEPSDRFPDVAELAAALAQFGPRGRSGTSARCRELLDRRAHLDRAAGSEFAFLGANGEGIAAPAWSASVGLLATGAASRRSGAWLVGGSVIAACLLVYALYVDDAAHRGGGPVAQVASVPDVAPVEPAVVLQQAAPSISAELPVETGPRSVTPSPVLLEVAAPDTSSQVAAALVPTDTLAPTVEPAPRPRARTPVRRASPAATPVVAPEPDVGF